MAVRGIELVGLRELEAKLENLLEIGGKPSRALDQAGRAAWKEPLLLARRLVPKDTWALHDALAITVKRSSKWLYGTLVHVSGLMIRPVSEQQRRKKYGTDRHGYVPNPRRYFHLVEFGTVHEGAHPYLRPPVDSQAGTIVTAFADKLATSTVRALERQERINGESFE